MARYIMEEMPDIQKTGKRITYPKFARIDNASIKMVFIVMRAM